MKIKKIIQLFLLILPLLIVSCNKSDDDSIFTGEKFTKLTNENISRASNGLYDVLKIETSKPIDFWEDGTQAKQSMNVKDKCKRSYAYHFKSNGEFSILMPTCNTSKSDNFFKGSYKIINDNTIEVNYEKDGKIVKETLDNVKLRITKEGEENYSERKYYLTFSKTDPRFSTILKYTLLNDNAMQATEW